jgi:hypothetical protein
LLVSIDPSRENADDLVERERLLDSGERREGFGKQRSLGDRARLQAEVASAGGEAHGGPLDVLLSIFGAAADSCSIAQGRRLRNSVSN